MGIDGEGATSLVSRVEKRSAFREPALHREIMRLRQVDNLHELAFSGIRVSEPCDRDRRRGRFRGVSRSRGACRGSGTCRCSRSRSS